MRIRSLLFAAAVSACVVMPGSSLAQEGTREITGPARAVNADTIDVNGTYVFLFGVESVERTQQCYIDGRTWSCYEAAVRALETIIGVAEVTCTLIEPPDYLSRWLGTCFVAGQNVNEALARTGFALAKRDETLDYVAAEEAAHAEGIGLWQGQFENPADYREGAGIVEDRP